MYSRSSIPFYDKIYASQGKDYEKEAAYLLEVIRKHSGNIRENAGRRPRRTLLDVACGTGGHLRFLRSHFEVEGVDVSLEFVRAARLRLPKVRFFVGDMRTFRSGREYDVVTCLFSSIGYMDTMPRLVSAIRNMARHLKPGGLLIVEPWFSPGQMVSGRVSAAIVDEEKLKLVRMSTTKVEGRISSFDFHYLVGTPAGTEHFVEKHKLGLYTRDEMESAFEQCGLSVQYDQKGPTGRGLYIAKRS